jgi:two-component system CheB/CheR fusion protein
MPPQRYGLEAAVPGRAPCTKRAGRSLDNGTKIAWSAAMSVPMSEIEHPRVVAIGASAGGLAAFQQLIEHVPSDTGMAFVLLSHILRGSKSMLSDILSRSTTMPVLEVTTQHQKVLGDHIYVLPPDKFMEIQDDCLRLIERPSTPRNGAIDHFLFSLAKDQARGSIGIILSGEGSDGAEGLKFLKEKGGMTVAQTPATASSSSMPRNAIEIDHVDCVLSPTEIAEQLGSREWCDSQIEKSPLRVLWSSGQQPSADRR